MTSVRKREPNESASERNGLCRATTRKGEPCRRKALGDDGLCLVHNGSQDMRELGRLGGRAIPKAKRPDAQRQSLREFLRREVDPARVWAAIEAGLESGNDRDRLAASKLLLTELYEAPADRRELETNEALATARATLASKLDEMEQRMTPERRIDRAKGQLRDAASDPRATKETVERCAAVLEILERRRPFVAPSSAVRPRHEIDHHERR